MKICVIANGYPNTRDPQWGCFERDQALALKKNGHDVSVLYVDRRYRTYSRKIGFTIIRNHEVEVYGMYIMPMRWVHLLPNSLHCRIIRRMFVHVFKKYYRDHEKPDIIYAHFLFNIFYASFIKEKYDIPLVGIEHWSGLMKPSLTTLEKYQGQVAYNKVDKLLAVSKSLQLQIKKHFGKDSHVVYNMLGQEFLFADIKERMRENQFVFVSVGSLLPVKNYSMLIKAFEESKLTEKGCMLLIVGEGSEHNALEKQIQEANLNNNVFLMGRKSKKEIIDLLGTSHVFVLSSKAETFGVACIEALSQGLPAVATKCGGPEEFIDDSNGILVEPGNVESMSKALNTIYENYGKFDNKLIANRCRQKFAPQTIAKQLTDVFEEILK